MTKKKLIVETCISKKGYGYKVISIQTKPVNKKLNNNFPAGLHLTKQTIRKFVGMPSWNIIFTGENIF